MSGRASSVYCVVCRNRESGVVRVVGPLKTADDALTEASALRMLNDAWDYMPDVMEPAEKIANEERR